MNRSFLTIASLLVGWLAVPLGAQAQTEDKEALNKLYGDFAPSDLSAATLLGVAASTVSKPSTVKALSASLIQPAKEFPKITSGLALEVAPMLFFSNNKVAAGRQTLDEYAKNAFWRNWTISGATVSDSASAKAAAGVAVMIYDGTDLLRVKSFVAHLIAELKQIQSGPELSALTRHASIEAAEDTKALLEQQGIIQSLSDVSLTNALYLELSPLIAKLGETPEDNAAILTTAEITIQHDAQLAVIQTRLVAAKATLPALNVEEVMDGARLLVKKGLTAYESYKTLNADLVAKTTATVKDANERFAKLAWNETIVQAGGGAVWSSTSQEFSSLNATSAGFFLRAAIRPGKIFFAKDEKNSWLATHGLLAANVRYNRYRNQRAFEQHKPTTQADSLDCQLWFGVRGLLGSQYFRLSLERSWQHLTYSGEAKKAVAAAEKQLHDLMNSYVIGAEVRLVEKVWLEFGLGVTYPSGHFRDQGRLLALSSIKYSIQNSQRFATQ